MRLLFGVVVVVAGLVAGGPALAGGWAVTTLDSVPAPRAGEVIEVGFTIRQHGVTGVNPEGDVGIGIRSEGGVERFFAAEPVGEVGHHVAAVTFPEEGTWTWSVRQGWFADQDLGTIDVAGPGGGANLASEYRWADWARAGLTATAMLLGGLAVIELVRSRRRGAVPA